MKDRKTAGYSNRTPLHPLYHSASWKGPAVASSGNKAEEEETGVKLSLGKEEDTCFLLSVLTWLCF